MSWWRERGPRGDHGQKGERGERGERGADGAPGVSARGLTWGQALAMFFLVLVTALGLSFRAEVQARQIAANAAGLERANYEGCLSGVVILDKFNHQQDALAAIERRLAKTAVSEAGRQAAEDRVAAYEAARTVPLPECHE